MGRPSSGHGAEPTTPFTLRRVSINQGGYDSGGAYWGTGAPLYYFEAYEECDGDETEISDFIRASSREHAKDIITARYPGARFKR